MPRTLSEFEDSVTLKLYLLQFVNNYSSCFYIAFCRGRQLIGRPGAYTRVWTFRLEECSLFGCMRELGYQLLIILVGRQLYARVRDVGVPYMKRRWQARRIAVSLAEEERMRASQMQSLDHRMVSDLSLLPWDDSLLFDEYLAMVLQFGLVTLFSVAFPLAPLLAFVNNIFEIRLDATKILGSYRRPVVRRVSDIGVWYKILDMLAKLGVITTGFIIAFTSDVVPRLLYKYYESPDGTMQGYVNYTLSVFDVGDFEANTAPVDSKYPDTRQCHYQDMRHPKNTNLGEYALNRRFYMVLVGRLVFVLVYENVVAALMMLVLWCMPKQRSGLAEKIKKEAYLTNEMIIQQERRNMRKWQHDSSEA